MKMHNSGSDRHGATHFWPFATLVWVATHTSATAVENGPTYSFSSRNLLQKETFIFVVTAQAEGAAYVCKARSGKQ